MQYSRSSKSEILFKSHETAVDNNLTEIPQTQVAPHEDLTCTENAPENDNSRNQSASPEDLKNMSEIDELFVVDCATSTGYLTFCEEDKEQSDEEMMDATDDKSRDETTLVDLAYMNINTNGKSMGDGMHQLLEPSTGLQHKACLTKVKHINIGEVPLKPVGLSLSGSGMQLFVQVDSEQKKKLLANTNVKCTSRLRKVRGTKRESKGRTNVLSSTTQTADMPTPLSKVPLTSLPNHSMPANINPRTESLESIQEILPSYDIKMRSWEDQRNVQNSTFIVDKSYLKHQRYYEDSHSPTNTCQNAQKRVRSNSPVGEHRRGSIKVAAPGQLVCQSAHGGRTHPLISGPSWKFENGKIDVSNTTTKRDSFNDVGDASDDLIRLDDGCRECPSVFTSHDHLPKSTHQSALEPSKRSQRHQYRNSQYDKRHEGHRLSTYYADPQDYSSPSPDGSPGVSDDEFEVGYNRQNRHGKKKDISISRHGHDKEHKMAQEVQQALEHVRVKAEPSDAPSLSRMFDKATSSTSIIDHASLSSVTLDEATLAKFTEYTTNMRKDLKQNFKNLSQLIKEFNHEVLERNNNRSSQSTSTVGSETKDCGPAKSRSTCSVM